MRYLICLGFSSKRQSAVRYKMKNEGLDIRIVLGSLNCKESYIKLRDMITSASRIIAYRLD